jgi:DNA-binding MarR family transcriptional regulator
LSRIRQTPGIGVCDLADAELISRPSMSSRIKRLVAEGLVSRAEDLTDGRRAGLAITRAGQRKIEAIKRRRNDWLAERIGELSAAERARLSAAAAAITHMVRLGS